MTTADQTFKLDCLVLLESFGTKHLHAFVPQPVESDYWARFNMVVKHAEFFGKNCSLDIGEACAAAVLVFISRRHAHIWSYTETSSICYALGATSAEALRKVSTVWSAALNQLCKVQVFTPQSSPMSEHFDSSSGYSSSAVINGYIQMKPASD